MLRNVTADRGIFGMQGSKLLTARDRREASILNVMMEGILLQGRKGRNMTAGSKEGEVMMRKNEEKRCCEWIE